MLKHPKVTIIMPTYNRAKMLKNAIDSVLNQTFKNFELIIINDGSTDDTEETVIKLRDPRVIYLKQKNGGPSRAMNLGLSKVKGKYISYLGDDDIYYRHHLKVLSEFLDRHADIGFVYGQVHFKKGKKIFKPYDFNFSKERLELDNFIPSNSLMHRRTCLKKTGLFDEKLPVAMDWDMWLKISDNYRLSHIETFVAQVRLHKHNLTYTTKDYYKTYMYIIRERLSFQKQKLNPRIPFEGYYMALVYRLIYKFKTEKNLCIDFIKELIEMDRKHPEVWMCLCACYLAYKDFGSAIKAGLKALHIIPTKKETMNEFQKRCVFNIHRLLAYAYKEKLNSHNMLSELRNALKFFTKGSRKTESFSDLDGITSRFLNRFYTSKYV